MLMEALDMLRLHRALDFVSDTDWPVDGNEVAWLVSRESHDNFLRFYDAAAAYDFFSRCEVFREWLYEMTPRAASRLVSHHVTVGVVGSHAALSLEPASALQTAWGPEMVTLRYVGNWAWCSAVDNCDEPLALVLRKYQNSWAERDMRDNSVKFSELADEMVALFQIHEPLRNVDFYICTRPFFLCFLLRSICDAKPILHYYSGPVLFDTVDSWRTAMLLQMRWMHLNSEFDVVASSGTLQSAWMVEQAGITPPLVRPHGLYIAARYVAKQADPNSAIFLRSTFMSFDAGTLFLAMVQRLLELAGSPLQIAVMHPGVDVSKEEIAQHGWACFLPDQPDKLTFWEIYGMNMPMLMPSGRLYIRMHEANAADSCFHNKWRHVLPGCNSSSRFPFDVFYRPTKSRAGAILCDPVADGPMKSLFFWHLSDYALFPHVELFSSASALVDKLSGGVDRQLASELLAWYNRHTWEKYTQPFYWAAARTLIGG
mmetsp:Transcript_33423/g.86857  ORF Transcript_33423/g.86857 Transcript_33423/m.86857 type:complete len:485 (-) Transcript_33423:32-1486(-)